MSDIDRVKQYQFKSGEEAAKAGRRGGIASGRAKKARKTFRESLKILLSGQIEKGSKLYLDTKKQMKSLGISGEPTGQDLIDLGVFRKAMKGDTFAASFIRDTIGEKPVEAYEDVTPRNPIVLGVIPQEKVDEAKASKQKRIQEEN